MKPLFKTERLIVRQVEPHDHDLIRYLNTDPEVLKYISGGVALTPEQNAGMFERIAGWNKTSGGNLGLFMADIVGENGKTETIGWFLLKELAGTNDIELGYRFKKEYWGKGYATEGSRGLVDHAFGPAGLKTIVAITHLENFNSQNVLKKCGFEFEKDFLYTSPVMGSSIQVRLFRLNLSE